jgi:large subunit ribosomal protein L18
MKKLSRNKSRLQRTKRIRAKINGTADVPRLSVYKSLKGIWTQVINDETGKTLVSASSKAAKAKDDLEGAKKVGILLAKKCLEKKIEKVVFDRAGYKYHGKVKALAEGARGGGLIF